jgi:hypothetical protein
MCSSCIELREHCIKLFTEDKGTLKMLLIMAHWDKTNKDFQEIIRATGFNPSKMWWDVIIEFADKEGLLEK